jgi:putative transposase
MVEAAAERKAFKYRLCPTPEQERALETTLWRCRTLYNVALEERKTAWERRGVSLTYPDQCRELPDLKAAWPEYAKGHSQVMQDVLHRLERTFQAFFRRVREGGRPVSPRFQGRTRYHRFTYPQYGNGAVLDGGVLALAKLGRIPIRLLRPLEGTPKTVTISHEADGWCACIACAEVPTHPLPPTGRETGIDVRFKAFLVTADGVFVEHPRHHRKSERSLAKCQQRVARWKQGSQRRGKAARLLAKACQTVRCQRHDFHHQTALLLVRAYDTIYVEDLQVRNMTRRPAPQPDGTGATSKTAPPRRA